MAHVKLPRIDAILRRETRLASSAFSHSDLTSWAFITGSEKDILIESNIIPKYSITWDGITTDFSQLTRKPELCKRNCRKIL